MTIAIIGAGIAGAACAQMLAQQGRAPRVFDKGRSPGGRMSSKRTEHGYLDFGAQYFTARHVDFIQQCQQWRDAAVIARWQGRLATYQAGQLTASPDDTERFIGVPSMQRPVQQLLQDIPVQQAQISRLQFMQGQWQLYSDGQLISQFTQLVLAVPQQQAAELLAAWIPQHAALSAVFAQPALLPCWAVNIQLAAPVTTEVDGVFVKADPALSWLARQATKPGRANGEHWLLHFNPQWSQQHVEATAEHIAALAVTELQRVLAAPLQVVTVQCHRWRYAQQANGYQAAGACYLPQLQLALCGDWLNGGRVENAWLSGRQAAREIGQCKAQC